MVTQTTPMLEHALEYARRGWAVMPLHTPRPANGCSCRKPDCDSQVKHPRTQNGLNERHHRRGTHPYVVGDVAGRPTSASPAGPPGW